MNEPSPLPTASDPMTTPDFDQDIPNEIPPPSDDDPALPKPECLTLNDDAGDLAELIAAMRAAMDPNSELETDDPENWRGHHD